MYKYQRLVRERIECVCIINMWRCVIRGGNGEWMTRSRRKKAHLNSDMVAIESQKQKVSWKLIFGD